MDYLANQSIDKHIGNMSFETDLSLVHLVEPFQLGEQNNVYPGCLLEDQRSFEDLFVFAGYGAIEENENKSEIIEIFNNQTTGFKYRVTAVELRATHLKHSMTCVFEVMIFKQVIYPDKNSQYICASDKYSGIWNGDSGMPEDSLK